MITISSKYSQSFITAIDNILSDSYTDIYLRDDFIQLFHLLDRYMMFDKDKIWAQFDMHTTRDLFQRRKGIRVLSGLLEILVNKNILEATNYHFDLHNVENSYTRKYKYTDWFLEQTINEEINFKYENISYKFYDRLQKENIPTKTHLLAQYNLIKSDRFKIDLIGASQWLLNRLISNEITKAQYHIHQRVILSLDDKIGIFCVEDEKTGRVFTNFTCMKRELRKYCSIDNEPLHSFDLKSAQPYLLASQLIRNYDYNDVFTFYSTITESDIYNHFSLCSSTYYTRDESKIEFMRYLYKDTRGSVPYEDIMKEQFPNVHRIVNEMKLDAKRKGENLAIVLQREESKIFVEGTKSEISKGALTVHDSVYFKESLKGEIEKVLEGVLRDKHNFKYSLKLSL